MTLHLVEGQDFSVNYSLGSRLGQSQNVETWQATDTNLGEDVVLTIFTESLSEAEAQQLLATIDKARGLVHPNIARPQALLEHDGHHFIVSQFVPKCSPFLPGREGLAGDAVPLEQLFDAITFAHGLGIAHGHIQPGNLLLDEAGSLHVTGYGLPAKWHNNSSHVEYLSPQIKSTPQSTADRSDDIYSCGQVLAVMLTGKTWREGNAFETLMPVPEEVKRLVLTMLEPVPYDRPNRLDEAANTIHGFLTGSGSVAPDESFRKATPKSAHSSQAAEALRPTRERRVIPASLAYTGLLLTIAAGIVLFLLLPEAEPIAYEPVLKQESELPTPAPSSADGEAQPEETLTPLERARLAQLEIDSEAAAKEFLRLQLDLEDLGINLWARDEYETALRTGEEADLAYRDGRFEEALTAYQGGIENLSRLKEGASTVLEESLSRGAAAIDAGNAIAAIEAYTIALAIDPRNDNASSGLSLAENLDTLNGLLADASFLRSEGKLSEARAKVLEARQIDSTWQPVAAALADIDAQIAIEQFNDAMSRGLIALNDGRFDDARDAFEEAQQILPDSGEPADGLEQVEVAIRARNLAELRKQVDTHTRAEDWAAAIPVYEQLLAIDPSLVFASDGLDLARSRNQLDEAIERVLTQPTLLASDEELSEARSLIARAARIEDKGPKLEQQLDDLSLHISLARIPMPVQLRSDNLTNITVYRVGQLGRLESQTLELLPGHYTIVGSRRGYRDVSVELTLIGGNPHPPVDVRCTEKI